jgi:hypothetical protein
MPTSLKVLGPVYAGRNQGIHLALRQSGKLLFVLIDKAKKSHGYLGIGVNGLAQ